MRAPRNRGMVRTARLPFVSVSGMLSVLSRAWNQLMTTFPFVVCSIHLLHLYLQITKMSTHLPLYHLREAFPHDLAPQKAESKTDGSIERERQILIKQDIISPISDNLPSPLDPCCTMAMIDTQSKPQHRISNLRR